MPAGRASPRVAGRATQTSASYRPGWRMRPAAPALAVVPTRNAGMWPSWPGARPDRCAHKRQRGRGVRRPPHESAAARRRGLIDGRSRGRKTCWHRRVGIAVRGRSRRGLAGSWGAARADAGWPRRPPSGPSRPGHRSRRRRAAPRPEWCRSGGGRYFRCLTNRCCGCHRG